MKKTFLFLSLLLYVYFPIFAQDCESPSAQEWINGNNIRAVVSNIGNNFTTASGSAGFLVPFSGEGSPSSIFTQSIWIGGLDPGGNLKLAGQTFEFTEGETDYYPGPLLNDGDSDLMTCSDWDKVWKVTRFQIEHHQADFADNGIIDQPIAAIMAWPGLDNPHFLQYNGFSFPDVTYGFAPFFDLNGDARYNPLDGDYPYVPQSTILPEEITYTVFNDAGGLHLESMGVPIQIEIHQVNWAFYCSDEEVLNNTLFTSNRFIFKGVEAINDTYVGIWTDFDIGCSEDDYFGSIPQLNTIYAYNADTLDGVLPGSCSGFGIPYDSFPPAQGLTVLNQTLDGTLITNNFPEAPLGASDPNNALEFYELLQGNWKDGSPLTYGGNGYQTGMDTNFIFPDLPTDSSGWSMLTAGLAGRDLRGIARVKIGDLLPGRVFSIDMAHVWVREDSLDYLGNVTALYEKIPDIQSFYDNQFADICNQEEFCEEDCVWPGDTNADGIANHCDLLPIGFALDSVGPTRDGLLNWSPKSAENWLISSLVNFDQKHVDCDGSGFISENDLNVLNLNYGQTRPGYIPTPDVYIEGPELYMRTTANSDTLDPGASTFLIGEKIDGLDLRAVAFTLEFDTSFLRFGLFITNLAGGLEIHFPEDPAGAHQFEVALVGETPLDSISRLFGSNVRIRSDLVLPLAVDSTVIRIKNIKGYDAQGNLLNIGSTDYTLWVRDETVNTEEQFLKRVEVYPNPSSGRLQLDIPEGGVDQVVVTSIEGKQMMTITNLNPGTLSFDWTAFPSGLYFITLIKDENRLTKKVVLNR